MGILGKLGESFRATKEGLTKAYNVFDRNRGTISKYLDKATPFLTAISPHFGMMAKGASKYLEVTDKYKHELPEGNAHDKIANKIHQVTKPTPTPTPTIKAIESGAQGRLENRQQANRIRHPVGCNPLSDPCA